MVQRPSTSGSPYSFQRLMPDSFKPERETRKGKSSPKGKSARGETPTSESAPPSSFARFPWEIVYHVLQIAALDPSNTIPLLSLSSHHAAQLKQHVYHTVSLTSLPGIESFAALLRKRPEIGRLVRNLWIGPTNMDSDLLSALAPPEHYENSTTLDARYRANAFTRAILRSCRKTAHIALSGGLCNPASTYAYGTACQPKQLTCINPHSFVGGFGAPFFAKTEHIHLVDVSLTTDETEHLSRLPALTTLTWTSPRDDGEVTGDARKIADLAWRCEGHEESAPKDALASSPTLSFNQDTRSSTEVLTPRTQSRTGPSTLQRVHIVTSSTRREMLRRELNVVDHICLDDTDPVQRRSRKDASSRPQETTASSPPTPPSSIAANHSLASPLLSHAHQLNFGASPNPLDSGESSDLSLKPDFHPNSLRLSLDVESDLLDATSNLNLDTPLLANLFTVQTSTLPFNVVEEWQALRDEILSLQYRWDGYRPPRKHKKPHPAYPDDHGVEESGSVLPNGVVGARADEYKTIEDSFAEGSEALEYFYRRWLFSVVKEVRIRR